MIKDPWGVRKAQGIKDRLQQKYHNRGSGERGQVRKVQNVPKVPNVSNVPNVPNVPNV
jgi:hypothetical protein